MRIQATCRKRVFENPPAMDNWSEDCDQAAGEQSNGLFGNESSGVSRLDVDRECEDAQGEDLRCCLCRDMKPTFQPFTMYVQDTSCSHTVVVQ